MRVMVMAMGVPQDSILVETQSTNTMQNASELAERLPRGTARQIGLVISTTQMRRSEKVFRAIFPDDVIVPHPCLLCLWNCDRRDAHCPYRQRPGPEQSGPA